MISRTAEYALRAVVVLGSSRGARGRRSRSPTSPRSLLVLYPLDTAFPSVALTQTFSAADTPRETRKAPVVRVSVLS